MTRFTFCPKDPTLLHNLLANAMLASSASVAERRLPSPNLLSAAKAGNSHSTNVNFGLRGFCIAALIALMAALSRFAVDVGTFAPPPPDEGKLKRNNCDGVCCLGGGRRDVGLVEKEVLGSSSSAKRRANRGSEYIIRKVIVHYSGAMIALCVVCC